MSPVLIWIFPATMATSEHIPLQGHSRGRPMGHLQQISPPVMSHSARINFKFQTFTKVAKCPPRTRPLPFNLNNSVQSLGHHFGTPSKPTTSAPSELNFIQFEWSVQLKPNFIVQLHHTTLTKFASLKWNAKCRLLSIKLKLKNFQSPLWSIFFKKCINCVLFYWKARIKGRHGQKPLTLIISWFSFGFSSFPQS